MWWSFVVRESEPKLIISLKQVFRSTRNPAIKIFSKIIIITFITATIAMIIPGGGKKNQQLPE